MNYLFLGVFGSTVTIFCYFFSPAISQDLSKKKLPFDPNPEAFIEYLNSTAERTDQNTRQFFNPRRCRDGTWSDLGEEYETYQCEVDYKESSSLGERTCIGTPVDYNYYIHGGFSSLLQPDECSNWQQSKNDEVEQVERSSDTKRSERTDLDRVTRQDLVILGGVVVALSSALAFAVGKISRK